MPISSAAKSILEFKGVYTAVVTPFKPDGSVDFKNYDALLETQLASGVHGVVPCGTTGESPTLDSDEKFELITRAVKKCRSRALVIAGTGSNDTIKTIHDSKAACEAGADALLVVTPYYNKPSQAGLEEHFTAVADESTVPVILYNVPGRTAVSLSVETIVRLAKHPRICGIKDASGNMEFFGQMRAAIAQSSLDHPFYFLSGDDPTYWPFLACGGDGVISVASNLIPKCMRLIFEDWHEGRVGSGLALNEKLAPLFKALFIESNPVPVKTILSWMDRMNAKTRLPLVALSEVNASHLKEIWEGLLPHLREDRPREDIHAQP